jgi:hypothetical protein
VSIMGGTRNRAAAEFRRLLGPAVAQTWNGDPACGKRLSLTRPRNSAHCVQFLAPPPTNVIAFWFATEKTTSCDVTHLLRRVCEC